MQNMTARKDNEFEVKKILALAPAIGCVSQQQNFEVCLSTQGGVQYGGCQEFLRTVSSRAIEGPIVLAPSVKIALKAQYLNIPTITPRVCTHPIQWSDEFPIATIGNLLVVAITVRSAAKRSVATSA
jgi:hypothetical protein